MTFIFFILVKVKLKLWKFEAHIVYLKFVFYKKICLPNVNAETKKTEVLNKLRALVVFNPVAGSGKKLHIVRSIEKHLDKKQFDYRLIFTDYAGHGYEIALDAANNGYNIVVGVGGDGLLNEIARGLVNSDTAMGVIPTGSGNGLARHLKIPLKPVKAIDVLKHYKTIMMDTIIINDERLFCNIAGTGFDAFVAQKFAGSYKRGFVTYMRIILKEFIKFRPGNYHLIVDDKEFFPEATMISFANSSQFGNNAIIAPMASVTDGKLDICIMNKFRWYQAPYLGIMLLAGRIDKTSFMTYLKAADVKIKLPDGEPCHLDGDPFNLGNLLHIKVNKASLKVVVP